MLVGIACSFQDQGVVWCAEHADGFGDEIGSHPPQPTAVSAADCAHETVAVRTAAGSDFGDVAVASVVAIQPDVQTDQRIGIAEKIILPREVRHFSSMRMTRKSNR